MMTPARLLPARLLPAVAIATALAACQPAPPVAAPPPADECGAAGYQGLIGQPVAALKAMKFPIGSRVIGPDDAVTADYRPDRLNVEYGRGGLIEKISCY